MAATGYSKLDVHQIIHRELLVKLDEHVERFRLGTGRLGADLLGYLRYWLMAHITGVDRHLAQHVLHSSPMGEAAGTGVHAALAPAREVP
jgi:hemerythrin